MSQAISQEQSLEAETMRRVSWRLMPFLLLAYLLCYIDRVNVGFASLQMNKAVGIDPKIYGLGAGIFFVGYFILEVPSNLALERFGARKWIARIMLSLGRHLGGLRADRRADLVPRAALPAGCGGGRLLSRRHPLSHLLVPRRVPRQDRRHLHGRDPGRGPDRLAGLGRDPGHERRAGTGRLAVDLHPRSHPDHRARHRGFRRLSDKPNDARGSPPSRRPGSTPSSRANAAVRRASRRCRCGR